MLVVSRSEKIMKKQIVTDVALITYWRMGAMKIKHIQGKSPNADPYHRELWTIP